MCEVIEKNRLEAQIELLKGLVKDRIISIKDAAARVGMSEERFIKVAML